ncbi:MAG: hypothetical protein M1838_001517 [Thelocarpon superellum]|nr:MAG: hypothetical protein M1838_001517 [Thelocarpon superellum]
MSQEIKTVLIAGAAGNLGSKILDGLLAAGRFQVSVLSRADSTSRFPSHLTVHRTDYTPPSLASAMRGQDAVVSVLGRGGTFGGLEYRLIEAAVAAGVTRFIPSAFSGDNANARALERAPFLRGKKQVVDHLRQREADISWTAVNCGAFLDWGLAAANFGVDVAARSMTLYDPGHDQPFSASTLRTVGVSVARALSPEYADETCNREVYVSSFTTTQDQILACLERVSGATWRTHTERLGPLVDAAMEKFRRDDFSQTLLMIQGAMWDPDAGMNFEADGRLMNDALALPAEDLDEVVRGVLL